MSDFEVIQELKNRISALEEENKLLKKFVVSVESGNANSRSVVKFTKKRRKI